MLAEDGLHRDAGQLGVVVLVAEVAEPDVAELGRGALDQGVGTLFVAQVAVGAADAHLQVARVGTLPELLRLMVGLQHEVVGLCDALLDLVGDVAAVGDEAEVDALADDVIAHAVGAVVGNGKGRDGKFAQLEGLPFLQVAQLVFVYLPPDAPVGVDAAVDIGRGVDRYVLVAAQRADRLDVVGVVVGDEDALDLVELEPVLDEMFLERADADPAVYHQTVGVGV